MTVLPQTLVLADLHLARHTPPQVTADLARLVAAHPGARLVFAGDLLDLSAESPRLSRKEALDAALAGSPAVRAALGQHVGGGGELWLLAGNHDAAIGPPGFDEELASALGLAPSARGRVRTTPWFFREGALHVEHGHFYDPDNAPEHPLVFGERSLGVHFTEEFIARTGAHRYLQNNDSTPLTLFLDSFRWYGARAPFVIYRYFHAAIDAMLRSGPLYRAGGEAALGTPQVDGFAEEVGLPRSRLDEVLALGARPTLESLSRTFTRLYFDRVLATLALASGLGALGLGRRKEGAVLLALGAVAMGASWAAGHNRYGGTVPELLAQSAARVAEASGARLVIFGHTHREALGDGYANTGSFAFPRDAPGRPYLLIEGSAEAPRAVRRYLKRASTA